MGTYRTAQICLNGHVITKSADLHPELCQRFCSICGAETISACKDCKSSIRGNYDVPRVISIGETYSLPRFCHSCGQGYPWTAARLRAASDLADELEGLSVDDRELLKKSLEDLVRDSPATELAAVRVKRTLLKAGKTGADAIRSIVVDILSEAAKKALGM
jgi:hypothetical protein